MKKQYVIYAFFIILVLSVHVECVEDSLNDVFVPVVLPSEGYQSTCVDMMVDGEPAGGADAVREGARATMVIVELYLKWRAARGDFYEGRKFSDKIYFYPSTVWAVIDEILKGKSLQYNKKEQGICLCIEGMFGNGGHDFVRIVSEMQDMSCVEVDVRSLINSKPRHIEKFIQNLADQAASSDKGIIFVFPYFDLVADYLYAQKSIKHGEVTFNAINENLSHLIRQPHVGCIFMMHDASRMEWYFKDVMNPRMIRLLPPNALTRYRLIRFYCDLLCGKNLHDICSERLIAGMVYYSYGFTVQHIASMCARVAKEQESEDVSDITWSEAYCEQMALYRKECGALDAELNINTWDNLQVFGYRFNDFFYRWAYASGFYKPKLTTQYEDI